MLPEPWEEPGSLFDMVCAPPGNPVTTEGRRARVQTLPSGSKGPGPGTEMGEVRQSFKIAGWLEACPLPTWAAALAL